MSVRADVDRGLEIVTAMDRLEKELKQIEMRITKAGLEGEQIDLVDPDRDGKQFLARGSDQIVPVVFTADLLTKSFADNSPKHRMIEAASDGCLAQFFAPQTTWSTLFESGKAFRMRVAETLAQSGPMFVTACVARDKYGIPKSQIKVEWDRADQIAQIEKEAA